MVVSVKASLVLNKAMIWNCLQSHKCKKEDEISTSQRTCLSEGIGSIGVCFKIN